MKTYVEKSFDRNYIKNMDLQQVGVYYNVPIENIDKGLADKQLADFESELDVDYVSVSAYELENSSCIKSLENVEYDYTDELEIEDVFNSLMKDYEHYLIVLFNATWTGASGAKITDKYVDCFYRGYDCTMYVKGSSKNGKYLYLRESHHDVPTGHSTLIVGLTESEYEKLEKMNIQEKIDYGEKCLEKIEYFE